jgi:hypothetical protein
LLPPPPLFFFFPFFFQVNQPGFANGLIDALSKLIKEDGVLSTFAGLGAMLAKQVVGSKAWWWC